eukprot:9467244-Pyramimonas_sp.AAC.1
MTALFNTRPGFAELLELNVTTNTLLNTRASLSFYVLHGLGSQCFNMRNGPVTEAKQYLQPLQTKLLEAELERHNPESAVKPTIMMSIAQHLHTFDWVKVSWGPGREQLA